MGFDVLLHNDASYGFRALIDRLKPDWMDLHIVAESDRAGFEQYIRETLVLLHVLQPITSDMINMGTKLRLIQKLGVGVDTIDLDAARLKNVSVANMPGTNTNAVAEMTVALMLATLRRIGYLNEHTHAGAGWTLSADALDRVGELNGCVVGLIGMGPIARRVAELVTVFGSDVIYANRSEKDVPYRRRSLPELMAAADVISIHIPLTPDTAAILDEAAIARMKSNAVLINTARGGVIDQVALVRALAAKGIAGAGLDVFALEPLASGIFAGLENVVLTPHVAWLTPQTLERSLHVAFENCRRLRDGEKVMNVIE
jgi:phosphoglycerate dehydrogenase-like enzyme